MYFLETLQARAPCHGGGGGVYCIVFDIDGMLFAFLAPPAERQRSFSNAVVNFSLKIFISQKLFDNFFLLWHRALLGRYQCTVKMGIWLNHPKGQF